MFRCSETLAPCIRIYRSAGLQVVCIVMDQMVCDRRSARRQVPYVAMSSGRCTSGPVLNVQTGAALRRPFSRAVAAAATFVSVVASTSAWCRGTSQRTSLSDLSAALDAEASSITRRGAAAKSTLLSRRIAAGRSTPLTRREAAARSTPLAPSVVAGLSWPDRGHHVPALTVTSGGRGVGFNVACSGTPGGSTPATHLELCNSICNCSLYRLSLCSLPGGRRSEIS